MNVREYLEGKIATDGAVHLTLIDPDEQKPELAGEMVSSADSAGTDGIMIGGSTSAEGEILDETVKEIKKNTDLPTVLFPASEASISERADAIFFMSLLNSKNPYYITRAQMKGAPLVKKFGLEPISLAYLIVEPGGEVGRVGEAELIKTDDVETAVNYALAGQYFGLDYLYLEAGSGAEKPVPVEMVREVRKNIDSVLVVGGGIKTPELAAERVQAGANIIVTGTIIEEAEDKAKKIEKIVKKIKK